MQISISDLAIKKLKELRPEGQALRVKVVGGGCSGLSYKMEWITPDSIDTEKDRLVKIDDMQVAVDGKSLLFLAGSMLDYSDGLDGTGFVWSNPNAARSCGCGSSFNI